MYFRRTRATSGRRQVSAMTAALLLCAAFTLPIVATLAVSEWRAPGTMSENLGLADTDVDQADDSWVTLDFIQREALAHLATLPGGQDVTVYAKSDLTGACGPGAAGCTHLGGNVMWISPKAGTLPLVTHEWLHLQTNLLEQIWLRANPGLWPNVAVPFGAAPGIEGAADCAVQLLLPDWREGAELPYVAGECTVAQLQIAQAVIDDEPLWEVGIE